MRILSFLTLALFASILLVAPASAQSGKYELFGATCNGTGKGPGPVCISANPAGTLKTRVSLARNRNFALLVNTGNSARVVTGYELLGNSKSGKPLYLPTWLYDATAAGKPGKILRHGTMNVSTKPGWQKTSFKPIVLRPNTTFFLVFNSQTLLQPSIVLSGVRQTHFWAGPPNWSGPWNTQFWAFKVNCGISASRGTALLLMSDGVPTIGKMFTAELHYARGPGVAVHLLGASNTKWGPFTLPLDLTPAGANGCALNVSGDFLSVLVLQAGGVGTIPILIPNSAALVGAVFYQQVISRDLTTNALGLAFSNGAKGMIGK